MNDLENASCSACGRAFLAGRASDAANAAGCAPEEIGVALIEDSCLARVGIADLLARFQGLKVVAADTRACSTVLTRGGLDVALLKGGIRTGETLQTVQMLHEGDADLRVVLWDLFPAQSGMVELVTAGVSGFVLKDAPLEVVIRTVQFVAEGWTVIPHSLAETLCSEISGGTGIRSASHEPVRLTDREQEVVHLIGEGLSNKVISRRLGISVHTVKSHLRNVMDKLTLHSRLQIAKYVHEHEGM